MYSHWGNWHRLFVKVKYKASLNLLRGGDRSALTNRKVIIHDRDEYTTVYPRDFVTEANFTSHLGNTPECLGYDKVEAYGRDPNKLEVHGDG